jgi:hypothetical protein
MLQKYCNYIKQSASPVFIFLCFQNINELQPLKQHIKPLQWLLLHILRYRSRFCFKSDTILIVWFVLSPRFSTPAC